jgi:hydrogenase maturation protease
VSAVVVALGRRFAGDDAVGPAVADRLRGTAGLTVIEALDAASLALAVAAGGDVIVVDALVAPGEPGTVRVLGPEDLGRDATASLSSHGLDVAGALALGRALHRGADPPRVRIVGVTVAKPDPLAEAMSPAVAAAVGRAVQEVLTLVGEPGKP